MIKVNDFVPDQFSMFAEALANPTEYQNKLEKHSTMLAGLTEEIENENEMDNDTLGIALPKIRHVSISLASHIGCILCSLFIFHSISSLTPM